MRKTPKLPNRQPTTQPPTPEPNIDPFGQDATAEDISINTEEFGTVMWLLNDRLTAELRMLPERLRNERKSIARLRVYEMAMLILKFLEHPEVERHFGHRFDRIFGQLKTDINEVIEKPPVH